MLLQKGKSLKNAILKWLACPTDKYLENVHILDHTEDFI